MSNPLWFDRVTETSITTGTGAYTLAGAVAGYQPFSVIGDGQSAYYCAVGVNAAGAPNGGWEVGLGTYTLAGTLLARTAILASSNSGAAVNWGAGTKRIFLTEPAANILRTFTITLTDAQIKTLPSGSVTLSPVPGSGYMWMPVAGFIVMRTAAGAYTGIDPDAVLSIKYSTGALAYAFLPNDAAITNTDVGTTALTDFFGAFTKVAVFSPFAATEGVDEWGPVPKVQLLSAVENAGLVVDFNNNGAGNLTGGNAGNSGFISVDARLRKLS